MMPVVELKIDIITAVNDIDSDSTGAITGNLLDTK